MYRGGICYTYIPDDWPQRAGTDTYSSYARLEMWHLEQAAALAAGYAPRTTYLELSPAHGEPKSRKPSADAKTWGQLIQDADGELRRIVLRFNLYAKAYRPDFSWSNPYVMPSSFLTFCGECEIAVPRELREAVEAVEAKRRARGKAPTLHVPGSSGRRVDEREARYRQKTLEVCRELKDLGLSMSRRDLLVCVNTEFPLSDSRAPTRGFWGYVARWQKEPAGDQLREFLSAVLLTTPGPRGDEYKDRLTKNMPPKWASALQLVWARKPKSRKSRNSRKT